MEVPNDKESEEAFDESIEQINETLNAVGNCSTQANITGDSHSTPANNTGDSHSTPANNTGDSHSTPVNITGDSHSTPANITDDSHLTTERVSLREKYSLFNYDTDFKRCLI